MSAYSGRRVSSILYFTAGTVLLFDVPEQLTTYIVFNGFKIYFESNVWNVIQ